MQITISGFMQYTATSHIVLEKNEEFKNMKRNILKVCPCFSRLQQKSR